MKSEDYVTVRTKGDQDFSASYYVKQVLSR